MSGRRSVHILLATLLVTTMFAPAIGGQSVEEDLKKTDVTDEWSVRIDIGPNNLSIAPKDGVYTLEAEVFDSTGEFNLSNREGEEAVVRFEDERNVTTPLEDLHTPNPHEKCDGADTKVSDGVYIQCGTVDGPSDRFQLVDADDDGDADKNDLRITVPKSGLADASLVDQKVAINVWIDVEPDDRNPTAGSDAELGVHNPANGWYSLAKTGTDGTVDSTQDYTVTTVHVLSGTYLDVEATSPTVADPTADPFTLDATVDFPADMTDPEDPDGPVQAVRFEVPQHQVPTLNLRAGDSQVRSYTAHAAPGQDQDSFWQEPRTEDESGPHDFNESLVFETSDEATFLPGHRLDVTLGMALQGYPRHDETFRIDVSAVPEDGPSQTVGVLSVTVDRIAPYIVNATEGDGNKKVDVTFSEPVQESGTDGDLDADDFQYTDTSGDGAGSIASVAHTSGEDVATLTLDAVLTESDLGTDLVSPAGTIEDVAGNAAWPNRNINITDSSLPHATLAEADIGSDEIEMSFSEGVTSEDSDSLSISDLTIQETEMNLGIDHIHHNNGAVSATVHLTDDLTSTDVSTSPAYLRVVADQVESSTGKSVPETDVPLEDLTPPTVEIIETLNLRGGNADGHIDAVRVTFSEPVAVPSDTINRWTAWDSTEDEISLEAVTSDADGQADTLLLNFTDGVLDTSATPNLTHSNGLIRDRAAPPNRLTDLDAEDGSISRVDAAPPVLLDAATRDLDGNGMLDAYDLTFSEPIASGIIASDWNVSGVDATEVHAHHGDSLVLNFSEATLGNHTGETPQLTYDGASVGDLAGNGLPEVENGMIDEQDGAVPQILAASTQDRDGDGHLDAYNLTLSEPLDMSTLDASDWGVGSGSGGYALAADPFDQDAASRTLTLNLEQASSPDTGRTPHVTYSPGDAADLVGNPLAAIGDSDLSEVDAAPPVLVENMTADTDDNGLVDAYNLTFSEELDLDSGDLDAFAADWGVDVATVAGIGSDGGDEFTLDLTDIPSDLHTGTTPDLIYDSGDDWLNDTSGNAIHHLGTDDILEEDGIHPTVKSMETADADGDGFLDRVRVILTEPVDDTTLDEGTWTVDGIGSCETPSVSTGDTENDPVLLVEFCDHELDTGQTPRIEYDGGIQDLRDEPWEVDHESLTLESLDTSTDSIPVKDEAVPVIIDDPLTRDTDDNGKIDAYEVAFSEEIDGDTLNASFDAEAWNVDDRTVDAFTPVASENRTVLLEFPEAPSYDTDDTPDLTYDGPSVEDQAGKPLPSYDLTTSLSEQDDAEPRIVGVAGEQGETSIVLVFSEPVQAQGGGDLGSSDLNYFNHHSGGAVTITGVDHRVGNRTAVATLNEGLHPDDLGNDTVAAAKDAVLEHPSGRLVVPHEDHVPIADLGRPEPVSNTTIDMDKDDRADNITITFDEPIFDGPDESFLDPADWTVEAPYGNATGHVLDVRTGDDSDDDTIHLWLNETDAGLDTNATPWVEYTPGEIADHDGVPLAAFNETAEDDVAPVITGAVTRDLNANGTLDAYRLAFSEPVAAGIDPSDWNVSGENATGVQGHTGDRLILDFSEASVGNHTGEMPELTYDGSSVEDLAGNGLPAVDDETVDEQDAAAPVVLDAATQDRDADGVLDAYYLTFSEAVDDASFDASGVSIEDQTVSGWVTGAAADDAAGFLTFSGSSGTGETPDVTADAGLFVDLAETPNAMPSIGSGDVAETDAARPVVLSAVTADRDGNHVLDAYEVDFSEALDDGVVASEWAVDGVDADGVEALSDARLLLTFSESLTDHTGETPELTYDGSSVKDLAASPNLLDPIQDNSLKEQDAVAPAVLDAATQDRDGNGHLDAYNLTLTEPLDNSTLDASDWAVDSGGGYPLVTDAPFHQDFGSRVLTLNLVEGLSPDTGRTPNVTYAPGDAAALDLAGNPLGSIDSADLVEADGAPPIPITAARTADLDDDGRIETYHLWLSEQPTSQSLNRSGWTVGGNLAVHNVTLRGLDSAQLRIGFEEAGLLTNATPNLTYNASQGSIADSAGNFLGSIDSSFPERDGASPHPLSAATRDVDDDGVLDAFEVNFSEPVATWTAEPDLWTVEGPDGDQLRPWDFRPYAHPSERIHVMFFEPLWDTGQVPELIAAEDAIRDPAGNGIDEIQKDRALERDGAAPVLNRASSHSNRSGRTTQLNFTFSEPVDVRNASVDDFNVSGCTCSNLTLDTIEDVSSFAVFEFDPERDTNLSAHLTYEPANGSDRIADRANNPAEVNATPVLPEDLVRPVIKKAVTSDQDLDGHLDAVNVWFSESMAREHTDTDNWTVDGYQITSAEWLSSSHLSLDLVERNESDTDARPDVSYDPGLEPVADRSGNNLLAADNIMASDGARPVPIRASTWAGGDTIDINFSEPVRNASAGNLTVDDVRFLNGTDEDQPDRIEAVDHANATDNATVVLTSALTEDEFADASLIADESQVEGSADGLPVSGQSVPFTDPRTPTVFLANIAGNAPNNETIQIDWTVQATGPVEGVTSWATYGTPGHVDNQTATTEGVGDQSVTIGGLEPDTTYKFRVHADADNASAVTSKTQSVTTPDAGDSGEQPSQPQASVAKVTVVDVGATNATIAFDVNVPDDGWTSHVAYESGDGSTETSDAVAGSGRSTIEVTGLDPDTQYTFTAVVEDPEGVQAATSQEMTFQTLVAPSSLAIGSVTSGSHPDDAWTTARKIELSWSPPQAADAIEGYSYALSSPGSAPDATVEDKEPNATLTAADEGQFTFTVRTVASDGRLGPVASYGPIQIDDTPPSAPSLVLARPLAGGGVEITWSAGSDDHSGIPGYQVLSGSPNGSLSPVTDELITDRTYTDPEDATQDGTEYVYAVQAVDEVGLSSPEDAATDSVVADHGEDFTAPSAQTLDALAKHLGTSPTQIAAKAVDADGDGRFDALEDATGIQLVRETSIANRTVMLLGAAGSDRPEALWDPAEDEVADVQPTSGEVASVNQTDDGIVQASVEVDKSDGWIYANVTDPRPELTLTEVTSADGRTLAGDRVWREDGEVAFLDDPTVTYHLSYAAEELTGGSLVPWLVGALIVAAVVAGGVVVFRHRFE